MPAHLLPPLPPPPPYPQPLPPPTLRRRRSVTLVCISWHDAFYAEPLLWRSLDIYTGRWPDWQCSASSDDSAAKASKAQQEPQLLRNLELLVQRVGSLTEAAKLLYLPDDLQEQLLMHLQPGVLKSLAVSSVHRRYGASLPSAATFSGFTNLTALSLDCPQLPLCMAEAVAGMQQLRQLTARAYAVPEQLLNAAVRLTQLTALHLRSVKLPAGSRAALALRSLSQLQDLELSLRTVSDEGMYNGGTAVMPPPASFTQLSRFKLDSCQVSSQPVHRFRRISGLPGPQAVLCLQTTFPASCAQRLSSVPLYSSRAQILWSFAWPRLNAKVANALRSCCWITWQMALSCHACWTLCSQQTAGWPAWYWETVTCSLPLLALACHR